MANTVISLTNVKVHIEPGLIPGYQNVRVFLTNPDNGKTVSVDIFDGPAPCVSLEHHTGFVSDVVFSDDGSTLLI